MRTVTLYRCGCQHCDAAEQTLIKLTRRLKAAFEIRGVEEDETLKGMAGWRTPVVCVDGREISHFSLSPKLWEAALRGEPAAPGEFEGEVVDLDCYLGSRAHGKEHMACAQSCIRAGDPVGLLAAGEHLYLLLPDRSERSAFERLKDFAAERVLVRAEPCLSRGVEALIVHSVELQR